jgi:hypothetical protein
MNNKKVIIISIISLGLALLLSAFLFNCFKEDDSSVIKTTIKTYYKEFNERYEKDELGIRKLFNDNNSIKIITNTNMSMNNDKFILTGELYARKNEIYTNATIKTNEETYKTTALYDKNKVYWNVDKISPNYYYNEIKNDSNLGFNSNTAEIMEVFYDELVKSITNEKIVKDNEPIEINGKEVKTTHYYLEYKVKDAILIFANIIDRCEELDGINENDLKRIEEYLNSLIDSNLKNKDVLVRIDLYKEGNNDVAFTFVLYGKNKEAYKIEYVTYNNSYGKKVINIVVYKEDNEEINISITENSERERSIYINYQSKFEINGKTSDAESGSHIDFIIKEINGTNKNEIAKVQLDLGVISKNKEYSLKLSGYYKENDNTYSINSENRIISNKEKPKYEIDKEKAISYDSLNDKEKSELTSLLNKNIKDIEG